MANRSLTERVADVLADHATTFADEDGDLRCQCGKWLEPGEHEWPTHVAWMLEDALRLTEETRTLTDGWIQPSRNAMYYAQGLTPPPAVITNEHRYVTAWEEA